MEVLVTGATGYVGSRVAARLVDCGHRVYGVVRNTERSKALPPGVLPVVADLSQPEMLSEIARSMDATMHLAFSGHGGDWEVSVEMDRRAIAALAEAVAGTEKKLIVSNGTIFLGDSGSGRLREDAPIIEGHPAAIRGTATAQVRGYTTGNVFGVEMRLASFVYGYGGSVFLPVLLKAARSAGFAFYVDGGEARTSVVHVDAAAEAYVLALKNASAGSVFHIASEEEPSIRQIAEAVGAAVHLPVKSVSQEYAASMTDPFTAYFLTVNNRLQSLQARTELGWSHAGFDPLLYDVSMGSYASA